MRGVEDDVAACAGDLSNDVFHRHVSKWCRGMEIVLLDLAPKALELADDVSLRATNSIRPWRACSNFN